MRTYEEEERRKMKLGSRSASGSTSGMHSILLLAPGPGDIPPVFRRVHATAGWHEAVLSEVQQMRGAAYLRDCAIDSSQLTPDGRHVQPADTHGWHVVGLDRDIGVVGCARYRHHREPVVFEDLGVSQSALAKSAEWGAKARAAVEKEIDYAARNGLTCVEVGGWAVRDEIRGTPEALRIALSTYSLARSLGACIAITTATVRHHASTILRRIGGRRLGSSAGEELPTYYDPRYGCDMEIVWFDSRSPDPRYEKRIEEFRASLVDSPVLCAGSGLAALAQVVGGSSRPATQWTANQLASSLLAV
jgi:hypothetical protein